MRPTEVSTADPMAKPLPVAAVVLPRASRASVRSRTVAKSASSSYTISAIPPALSATGPYASVARVTPSVESMPPAPMEIPYTPAHALQPRMAAAMVTVGTTVESMPTPKPSMMTVAGPVSLFFAMFLVGEYVYEVQYSVKVPIVWPATKPMMMQPHSSNAAVRSS